MEKKNNKKLFAIIGGSVLAFILTIALSVSITLAYFGESKSATDLTMTLGQTLKFDGDVTASATAEADLTKMLPGGYTDITLTGKVAESTTKYYMRVSLVHDASVDEAAILDVTTPTISGGDLAEGYKLVPETVDDAFTYYYVCDASGAPVPLTAAGTTAYSVKLTFGIPADVTNADVQAIENMEVKISGTMAIIQSAHITATDVNTLHNNWNYEPTV